MLRTLIHYWRVHLAVALGAAVATAVLGGALLVGDSVRGSLRELTLDRLGRIDLALLPGRFFREGLAEDLAAGGLAGAAPAVVLRGAASGADSRARASQVAILGVDERFAALYGAKLDLTRRPEDSLPAVVLNEALARELQVASGDAILLHFARPADVPREMLMGETDPDDVLGRMRLGVRQVIPDRGIGRFGLLPTQAIALNAFVDLPQIQRVLGLAGQVNAVLTPAGASGADPALVLKSALALEDLGLTLARGPGFVTLGSREFVLRPEVDRVLDALAHEIEAPLLRTQSYLANTMRHGERRLPYSLVVALDPLPEPAWAALTLVDGRVAPPPGESEILLDAWAAEDLDAAAGDTLELRYFVVGPGEALAEEETSLRVAGVVRMEGLAADRTLTPDYPGIQEARDMAAWDPPFPVDLARIRPKDEAFWDAHGATPKAFVSEATGRKLWSTRFGSTTTARIGVSAGQSAAQLESALREGLLRALSADAFGFRFRTLREEGLRAASGATDFTMLFLSFSFFIILSAGLLVGLLFRLGVEQRTSEIGLLLALGYRVRSVRGRLLAEGLLLAGLGGVVGLAGGVGYAWSIMAGLRTLWRPAVGSSELYLHAAPASLPLGFAISVLVVLLSVALAVRKLVRLPPQRLLAGALGGGPRKRSRFTPVLSYGGLLVGLGLLAYALATRSTSHPALAFGSGAPLLIAGLAFFARFCRKSGRRALGRGRAALAGMAARNTSWNPGRSVSSVALVASASFLLVLVAASCTEEHDLRRKDSGAGGFALVAESDVPLHQDLESADGLFDLGFGDDAAAELAAATVTAFRALPGDDASCLNLYRPEKPKLLGAPHELIERGAFSFAQHLPLPPGEHNPWRLLEQPLEPGVIPAVADLNSAMWILHVQLGQELTVEDERGEPLRLRLVGLLERSVIQSEVLISEESFLAHFPSRTGRSYFLIDVPEEKSSRVSELLESTLAPFGFDVRTTQDKLADYQAVENTYLATFQLLGALGLLLGTVGLGIVLLRNVLERRGELATLRAFGFRRSRLAWLVLAENAFLLLVGLAIGSGAALAAVAPNLRGGHVPWTSLLSTLAAVWVVGMLSSVLAVRGTLRTPLLPALKAER